LDKIGPCQLRLTAETPSRHLVQKRNRRVADAEPSRAEALSERSSHEDSGHRLSLNLLIVATFLFQSPAVSVRSITDRFLGLPSLLLIPTFNSGAQLYNRQI